MPELKLLTRRIDKVNPLSIDDAILNGGYEPFKKAIKMDGIEIIEAVETAKLRGRGGAGFPMHLKMMSVAKQENKPKYLVCNADEGEPGNFKDRYLMEKDPHLVIEGILIAAHAMNVDKGYIYIRGEYNQAISIMKWAVDEAKEKGFIGENILGSGFNFDLEIRRGAGSYVVGEEFAMIESIEGKSGRTRVKPPFPSDVGVFGKPTLLNNVETFCNLPIIIEKGAEYFAGIGTKSSKGTKLISLSGNIEKPGVYEVPFGTTLREAIDVLGGGVTKGQSIKMVQLGGACGPIIPEFMLDLQIDYDRFEEFESKTGAGAIIVMDDRQDMFEVLNRIVNFFEHESCGRCTPCREGHVHVKRLMRKFMEATSNSDDLFQLESLARVMHQTSLCGLGQSSPVSIISTLGYFRDEYHERIMVEGGRK